MSFVDNIIKTSSEPIHYLKCRDDLGLPCYFFLMCSGDKFDQLDEARINGKVELSDYGKVIASGFGENPSDEVIAELKQKYDFEATEIIS